jgi:hypothetical protein
MAYPVDKSKYKYPWKHPKGERPHAVCYDCKMHYEEFSDMVIDDDLWEEISPTYWKGAGLLCPTCIANRLDFIGKWYDNGMFNRKSN